MVLGGAKNLDWSNKISKKNGESPLPRGVPNNKDQGQNSFLMADETRSEYSQSTASLSQEIRVQQRKKNTLGVVE
jgi:hypothetical protein